MTEGRIQDAPAEPESGGVLPPMSSGGFLRWCWRQLTSMRTALILLFLLALAAIPGSVFPQRGVDQVKVRDYIAANPTSGPILDRLGFFDVYSSPWFSAVYLLLFISLIGCVIPRSAQHYRAMRAKPPTTPRNLSRLPEWRSWTTDSSGTDVLDAMRKELKSSRWRVADYGTSLAAEKGFLRETGNLVFHISLVFLLGAVAFGGLWGWKGNVIVKEGGSFTDVLTQYDAWGGGRMVNSADIPPFSFTMDKFTVEWERGNAQKGAPRYFNADVTYRTQPGAPEQKTTIQVNEPLSVDGAKVYLVGHGYAPHVIVKDSSGKVTFDDSVVFLPQDGNFTSTGVVKVPDMDPQLGFQGIFLPTTAVDSARGPHSLFPAPDDPELFLSGWEGDLGLDGGAPQSVYKLDTSHMTEFGLERMRIGDTWTLPNGSGTISFVGLDQWASFQINHDPGSLPALICVIFAIAGLVASIVVRRRRVWVKVSPGDDGRTVIEIAGLGRSELGSPAAEVDHLVSIATRVAPPVGTNAGEGNS